MKNLTRLLPAAFLILAIPLTGFAVGHGQGPGGGCGMHGEQKQQLKQMYESLSSEQKDQIKDLRTAHQKEMVDLKADLQKQMIELQELISDDAAESKIMTKIDEIGRKRTDMQKKKVKLILDIKNLLTDEQKEMLDGMGMHGLIGGPGGHGGPGGQQGHKHGPRHGGGPAEHGDCPLDVE